MNQMLQSVPEAIQQAGPPGVEFLAPVPAAGEESNGDSEQSTQTADTETEDPLAQESITSPATEVEEGPEVTVRNPSVNIRSGPGLDYSVILGAVEGETFTTVGRSSDGWWRICCVPVPDDDEGRNQLAWISDRVVTANETALALDPLLPLFPSTLEAEWSVVYECGSDRCTVDSCRGTVLATVRSDTDPAYLEIDRQVAWDEACGENSSWLHEIDRLDGSERYGNPTGLFLFDYWAGAEPGVVNGLFSLTEEMQIRTWCSDEQIAELEEAEGWTTVYEGKTCHDVRTGMLVSMHYTKRWLFSGTYEGEVYDRAYFGDFEVYRVRLNSTNVVLATVSSSSAEPADAVVDETVTP